MSAVLTRARIVWAVIAVAIVAVVAGTVAIVSATSAGRADAAPTAVVSEEENPFAAGGLQDPAAATPDADRGVPVRITIPSIGVSSSLEDLVLGAGGELTDPEDYDLAGWYTDGVVPGEVGPAIIAGHIDSPTGPAVFTDLPAVADGAEVVVEMSDGSEVRFVVSGRMQSEKATFPTDAVYRNVPTPQLRLITCAGSFDPATGHYTDNLILFASLAP